MVLSHQDEPVGSFLRRLNADRVTHLSGTPSHWRRAVMSGHASDIAPSYARLSGEVADQGVLDRLSALYPSAELTHAFATTEVGVAFTVTDGRAGFPEHFIGASDRLAQIKVSRGSLWVKSESMASRYLGTMALLSRDDEGFIDTGDMVEYLEGRLYFNGRREGVINIGGNKVYPEEVEAIINRHPAVLMSRVWGRSNPITGTLISADIVLSNAFAGDAPAPIQAEIIESCRQSLPPHKVPVSLKLVSDISMMSSGKVARRHA
jgi:acyl-CoA synthetase (AMP-forming)/AMP-acid ligase II